MTEQSDWNSPSASSASGVATWIIFAGLLVFGVLIGLGFMAIMSYNQQSQTATGSQTVPSSR